jgi:U3 small nucleolar RNA-associated protein 7
VPFEDIVGMGTDNGFSSIAVPGCGMPFYDTFEENPFESKKQKR